MKRFVAMILTSTRALQIEAGRRAGTILCLFLFGIAVSPSFAFAEATGGGSARISAFASAGRAESENASQTFEDFDFTTLFDRTVNAFARNQFIPGTTAKGTTEQRSEFVSSGANLSLNSAAAILAECDRESVLQTPVGGGSSHLGAGFRITDTAMLFELEGTMFASEDEGNWVLMEFGGDSYETVRVGVGRDAHGELGPPDIETPILLKGRLEPGAYELRVASEARCEGRGSGSAVSTVTLRLRPAPPIIFLHGFSGSKIACGGETLFPALPFFKLPKMRLEADGETNLQEGSCNPIAAPTEIFDSFVVDIYGRTLEFLDEIAPDNHYVYVWDWRKSPQLAVDGLDELVELARCGRELVPGETSCAEPEYEKVVLMAHSMGGLIVRDYINDPSRADKVARALTIGTPYWGAPKAVFPLLIGQESPSFSALDALILDTQFHEWAKNAQGLFFLYPSANFGDWLTIRNEPVPRDRQGMLDLVAEIGGTPALLAKALDAHAADLDGFRTNGVDYQAIVGSGLATIDRVRFFTVTPPSGPPLDFVRLTYTNGDETVPVRSATQGPEGTPDPLGEDIPIHAACGVSHVPLPGHPAVTGRIKDFLLQGDEIVPGPVICASSSGFQVQIYQTRIFTAQATSAGPGSPQGVIAASAPTVSTASAGPMSLEDAELAGLIQLIDLGHQIIIITDSRTPVELSYSAEQFDLNATPLTDAELGETAYYGPLSGTVTLSVGETLTVSDAGGPVEPRSDGAPSLSVGDATVLEGFTASVTVTLSRPVGFPVTVEYATGDGSATAGADYESREGTLIIAPGEQSGTIEIPTMADGEPERTETFRLRLSDPFDASITDGEATINVQDAQCGGGGLPALDDVVPCLLLALPDLPLG